jgi:hypothetical protein
MKNMNLTTDGTDMERVNHGHTRLSIRVISVIRG